MVKLKIWLLAIRKFCTFNPLQHLAVTLAVIVRRHAKQTVKQIKKQNLNLQNGTI
jgi:hypothetical protein